jgi:hypothetical protein
MSSRVLRRCPDTDLLAAGELQQRRRGGRLALQPERAQTLPGLLLIHGLALLSKVLDEVCERSDLRVIGSWSDGERFDGVLGEVSNRCVLS